MQICKKKLSTAQSNRNNKSNSSNNLPQPTNQQNELGSLANSLAAQGEQTGALSLSLSLLWSSHQRQASNSNNN